MGQRRRAFEALFGSSNTSTATAPSTRPRQQRQQQQEQEGEDDDGVVEATSVSDRPAAAELVSLEGRGVVSRMLNRRHFVTNINASLATASHNHGPARFDVWRQIQHAVRRRRAGDAEADAEADAEGDAEGDAGGSGEDGAAVTRAAHAPAVTRVHLPPSPPHNNDGATPTSTSTTAAAAPAVAMLPSHQQQQQQQQQHRRSAGVTEGVRDPIPQQRNVRLAGAHARAPQRQQNGRREEMSVSLPVVLVPVSLLFSPPFVFAFWLCIALHHHPALLTQPHFSLLP